MSPASSAPTDPLECVVARCWRSVEELFRRHALDSEEARALFDEALPRIESLYGVVPGAGHRLLKLLEAACRRARSRGRSSHPPATGNYESLFTEIVSRLRQRRQDSDAERARSESLVDEIEAQVTGSLELPSAILVAGRESRELALALLERSRQRWKTDARCSLVLAEAGLSVISALREDAPRCRLAADIEARALAYAGNAHRVMQDYRRAESALRAAEALLARGTQDPRERSLVLSLLANLRRDQRRLPESLRLLEQAAAIYRWSREQHLEGSVYSKMAVAHAYAGQPELAIRLAERAAELIDPERDPVLAASIEHNMTHFLCAAGRPQEARDRLPVARRLMRVLGTESDLRLLRWIEAQIAFALGERDEGERLLLGVRDEFIAAGNRYDTALVSLELAAEYLDQGRSADARRLAAETLPIFQSLEVHREALAALIAVQRAIEMESATAELVRELLATLQRARNGPPPRPEQPS
jgi:tetratricopeptide (TPR) repeat protein